MIFLSPVLSQRRHIGITLTPIRRLASASSSCGIVVVAITLFRRIFLWNYLTQSPEILYAASARGPLPRLPISDLYVTYFLFTDLVHFTNTLNAGDIRLPSETPSSKYLKSPRELPVQVYITVLNLSISLNCY